MNPRFCIRGFLDSLGLVFFKSKVVDIFLVSCCSLGRASFKSICCFSEHFLIADFEKITHQQIFVSFTSKTAFCLEKESVTLQLNEGAGF